MSDIRIAIVGFGKIAHDQHVPAIATTDGVTLVAVADPNPVTASVPHFRSLEELLREGPEIDAVALATPPQIRRAQAALALAAQKHVFLEKPPGRAISEILPLIAAAREARRSLFASWHARFAPAVEPARRLLAERKLLGATITWKEDVRKWHPGQEWIFAPGGFGVFDPGINALSILTRILPRPPFVTASTLEIPANRAAPIAVELELSDGAGLPIRASFDFRERNREIWEIHIETDKGPVSLSAGGARLLAGAEILVDAKKDSYPLLYRRFVELVRENRSDVDLSPLQLVADAFLLGRARQAESFDF
ncbi:Gfo/Idh/MocA family oxidoreductase [Bradyrhizobium sp. ARR65]|uniref:Gfo/Idh/MocA family protein n=1 Tax=Bradyrhizobium sp. ARR65 TaxID=1040989 RepID=UPI0004678486|nr:Gfo/Idh/MocA family oxidoreductase [Bradyrhizobium sp. ARR65]